MLLLYSLLVSDRVVNGASEFWRPVVRLDDQVAALGRPLLSRALESPVQRSILHIAFYSSRYPAMLARLAGACL